MSQRIRWHFRNNVVGYIALFFALTGGTAYALQGRNTVFSDDIVNGQVRSADVANDGTSFALTGADVSNANGGSLTGLDIRESTLSGVGVSGVEYVEMSSSSNSNSPKSATATCPAGKVVVGAGGATSGAQEGTFPNIESNVAITGIIPSASGDFVIAEASEVDPTTADWVLLAEAVCAKAP